MGAEKEITEPIAPIAPTHRSRDASEETEANNEEETPFLKPTPAVDSLNANMSADLTAEKESINQAEPTLNEASERDVEEAMKVYTLDSAPLPTTSDEPNLGGIRFHEAKKEETPAPEPAQTPLSQTADNHTLWQSRPHSTCDEATRFRGQRPEISASNNSPEN